MSMRTLILSDIHLGSGGPYDIYAGGSDLPQLLHSMASPPTRVIFNGDTVDFLLNEDPLQMDVARAVRQAHAIVGSPETAAVLQALGQLLAAGGEVIIRLGNHDAELALGEVQQVIRQALGQPADIAARLVFERGAEPRVLTVGGARVLVAHGEHNDSWNRLDYDNLPGPGAPDGASPDGFVYPPGSRLVKTLLNPMKRLYGIRFADLLKPDFQGAVLTALAVNPAAVRQVFQGSTATMLWQLFRRSMGPSSFGGEDEEVDLGLADSLKQVGLSADEEAALMAALSGGPAAFADEDALDGAQQKLALSGLKLYARAHRSMAGKEGELFFDLQPSADEWTEAERLAKKFDVGAVVLGHTHAARFRSHGGLTFLNTGTWIWLMQLPSSDAPTEEWVHFLQVCRINPQLDPQKGETVPLLRRLNGALVEEQGSDGARLALVEWVPGQGLLTRQDSHIPAVRAAAQ